MLSRHMKFHKYDALGNDFILIDTREQVFVPDVQIIKNLCDRKIGIGADGVLVVQKHRSSNFKVSIFNADGSNGGFSGNGSRCVADYLLSQVSGEEISFMMGINSIKAWRSGDCIETLIEIVPSVSGEKSINGFQGFFIDIGNPHLIFFDNAIEDFETLAIMAQSAVEGGCNVEHVTALSDKNHTYGMKVYERGVGITKSCGSAVCAITYKLFISETIKTDEKIRITMPGGTLMSWVRSSTEIVLSGTCQRTFGLGLQVFDRP